MTIISLTGTDIARILENGQYILCVKLKYEQGVIRGGELYSTASDGYVLMWIIAPLTRSLPAEDFHRILTYITELFPNKKVLWAYEEADEKQYTEIILLTTP